MNEPTKSKTDWDLENILRDNLDYEQGFDILLKRAYQLESELNQWKECASKLSEALEGCLCVCNEPFCEKTKALTLYNQLKQGEGK